MLQAIIRRLKRGKRGISTVIVVMLSLVLITIIVGNVVLWNYQMNQFDWERMRENLAIVNATSLRDTWPYNPSQYILKGSTSLLSGNLENLTSDDGVYMTFRSYYSGTVISDFVDNDASDVDSSPDKGIHSNFTAQKYGPDSIYDTLMEENTGSELLNSTLINGESFEGIWPPTGWSETGAWNKEDDEAYSGIYSADFDGGGQGYLITSDLDCANANAIYVDFWYRDGGCEPNEFLLQYYNGTSWNTISDLGETLLENQWLHYQERVTDSQYFKSTFKIRFSTITNHPSDDAFIDLMTVKKEIVEANYELDLEAQWTNAPYSLPHIQLCIFGGTMDSEYLRVDAWNGTAWQNLFTLKSGWNNASVSSYLISQTFTIRFKGTTEANDTVQDHWDIDVALLYAWSDEYIAEVEFIGSSNTENWHQLNWTVNSAWNTSLVNVTLQLFNYALGGYPTSGNGYIAYTSSSTSNTDEDKSQTIIANPTNFRNGTGHWKIKVKGVKADSAPFEFKADLIEIKAVKEEGTYFAFKNEGSLTVHIVAMWINNSTYHQRYDVSMFINSGDTLSLTYSDMILSDEQYNVKVVTERGNIAVSTID